MDMHAADTYKAPQFTYLGRLTTVIAASLVEATALANDDNFGRKFAEVVCQTRQFYNELLEELVIAGPGGSEFARGLTDSIGVRLEGLERQIAPVEAQVRAGSSKPVPLPTNDRAELWHVWR